jgi:hypothetical protein
MDYGTHQTPTLTLHDSLMLIGQEVLMTEKVHLADVSMLETILCLGIARSKIQFPCPLLKQSTLLLEVAVPNCYG